MKVTKEELKQIIKEEIAQVLDETNDLDEARAEPGTEMHGLEQIVKTINDQLDEAERLQAVPLRPGTIEMLKSFVYNYLYGKSKKKRGLKGLTKQAALGQMEPITVTTGVKG